MKKNGFTLIEILAVITLLAAMALVLLPLIINQVNQSQTKIDDGTMKVIENSTYTYMDMNQNEFPFMQGNVYCITLQKLADYGAIKTPITGEKSGKDIPLTKIVRATFTSDIDIDYALVDTCTETRN